MGRRVVDARTAENIRAHLQSIASQASVKVRVNYVIVQYNDSPSQTHTLRFETAPELGFLSYIAPFYRSLSAHSVPAPSFSLRVTLSLCLALIFSVLYFSLSSLSFFFHPITKDLFAGVKVQHRFTVLQRAAPKRWPA